MFPQLLVEGLSTLANGAVKVIERLIVMAIDLVKVITVQTIFRNLSLANSSIGVLGCVLIELEQPKMLIVTGIAFCFFCFKLLYL